MGTIYALQFVVSGLVAGFILFQSAIIAPTVFTVVDKESRGPLLRKVFPKLFKVTAAMGVVLVVLAVISPVESVIGQVVGGITFLSGIVCNAMIPATNNAKDTGDEKKFAKLHRLSVLLTLTVLFVNLFWVFIAV